MGRSGPDAANEASGSRTPKAAAADCDDTSGPSGSDSESDSSEEEPELEDNEDLQELMIPPSDFAVLHLKEVRHVTCYLVVFRPSTAVTHAPLAMNGCLRLLRLNAFARAGSHTCFGGASAWLFVR